MRTNKQVHETRSQSHAHEEDKVMTRKQKAESKAREGEQSPKKPKYENNKNGLQNRKSAADLTEEYEEFCKAINEHLSVDQMRQILEANGLDSSGSESSVIRKWLVNIYVWIFVSSRCYIYF